MSAIRGPKPTSAGRMWRGEGASRLTIMSQKCYQGRRREGRCYSQGGQISATAKEQVMTVLEHSGVKLRG